VRDSFLKAVVFVLAFGVAGCSTQGAHSVPTSAERAPASTGPALQAPALRHTMDVVAGPTGYKMNTSLGDAAPVLYGKTLAHFYIGVREIDAIGNGQTVVLGSAATPVQMDLLQYQNGSTNWMTQTDVPAQTYTQLRYVLDAPSTQAVFSDGTSMPIKFVGWSSKSSYNVGATTSTTLDATYANAIDVTINTPIGTQGADAIAADFNLTESLSVSNGTLIVRPTLSAADTPAQISGSVLNSNGAPVQNATVVALGSNGAAVNSATTDASGSFNLHALPADTYQLVIYNAYTNAAGYRLYSSGATSGSAGFYGPTIQAGAGASVNAGTIND
jgi:hypothetical protein